MKALFILMSLSFLSRPALAGGSGAHGGDAVICVDATGKKTVEVFDYFEASQTLTTTLDLGGQGLSYLERAKLVIERLKNLDPVMYKTYLDRANAFMFEAAILDRSSIPDIDDTHEVIKLPGRVGNCTKVQFAVQIQNPRKYEKRYLIDADLWNLADDSQKAGLILHEIVYRDHFDVHVLKENVPPIEGKSAVLLPSSVGTRYYTGVLSSHEFTSFTPVDYLNFVREIDEKDGPWSWSGGPNSVLIEGNIYRVDSRANTTGCMAEFNRREVSGIDELKFWPNGKLKFGHHLYNPLTLTTDKGTYKLTGLDFDESGKLIAGCLLTGFVNMSGNQVELLSGLVEFDELGNPKDIARRINYPVWLNLAGQKIQFRHLQWDESFKVLGGDFIMLKYRLGKYELVVVDGFATISPEGMVLNTKGYYQAQAIQVGNNVLDVLGWSSLRVYPNGNIQQIETANNGSMRLATAKSKIVNRMDSPITVAFYENEEIKSIRGQFAGVFSIESPIVRDTQVREIQEAEFYLNGQVRRVFSRDAWKGPKSSPLPKPLHIDESTLIFNEAGQLTRVCVSGGYEGKIVLSNGKKVKLEELTNSLRWELTYNDQLQIESARQIQKNEACK